MYADFFRALHPRAVGGKREHQLSVNHFSHGHKESQHVTAAARELYFNGPVGAVTQLTDVKTR